MKARAGLAAVGLLLAAAAAASCGQQGPLVLPEDARPVERIEPPTSEPGDDEERDER